MADKKIEVTVQEVESKDFDKEDAYDTVIEPLMKIVISACIEFDIPVFFTCMFKQQGDEVSNSQIYRNSANHFSPTLNDINSLMKIRKGQTEDLKGLDALRDILRSVFNKEEPEKSDNTSDNVKH